MPKVDPAKKSPVSAPILILGVVAVIAFVYLQFFSGTSSQPAGPNVAPQPVRPAQLAKPAQPAQPNQESAQLSPVTEMTSKLNQIVADVSEVGRDPFSLPSLLQRSKKDNFKVVSPPVIPAPINIPKVDIPKVTVENPKVTVVEEQPVLKGIIKTNTGQVAILYYKGKSFVLHPGEKLPSSDYRLKGINNTDVILESPSNQFKLQKKGEGKK